MKEEPEYLDCELYLTEGTARLSGGGQEGEGKTRLGEIAKALDRAESEHDFEGYGRLLFDAVFVEGGEPLAAYRSLRATCARDQRQRLRLSLANTAPNLHRYHWEYLYDPVEEFALGRSRKTPLSRYLAVQQEALVAVAGKPRLLVVLATPKDLEERGLAPLRREPMRRLVENSLQPVQDRFQCKYVEGAATKGKIRRELTHFEPHVLLFLGHGLLGETAGLALEDDAGRYQPLSESDLADLLDDDRHLRLVTLVACHSGELSSDDPYSGLAASLVKRGIPAVVAMRRQIDTRTAELFLHEFFSYLEHSGRLDAAVNEARAQIHYGKRQLTEWGTPALFMRLQDGRLWQDTPAAAGPAHRRPPAQPAVDWENLLARKWLVPILGPDLLDGLLPSQEKIAALWTRQHPDFPWKGSEHLPQVARIVETKTRKGAPHDLLFQDLVASLLPRLTEKQRQQLAEPQLSEVIDELGKDFFQDDEPHRILAELPIPYYLTTNVDSFLTAALKSVGKTSLRTHCRWREKIAANVPVKGYQDLAGEPDRPLVFHLYGNDEDSTSVVLTEDDHLAFLRAMSGHPNPYIPDLLRKALSESMLLFLGFRVEDLGCRVLFHGLVNPLANKRGRAAVIQLPEEDREKREALRHFIETCCDDVEIKEFFWGTPAEFLVKLRDRWRAK